MAKMTGNIRRKYTFRKVFRLVCSAVIFAIVLVAAEIAARNWLVTNRPSRYMIFAEHTPPPYKGAPYYSLEFLSEQSKAVRSLYFDDNAELRSDFHGRWYNFDDGNRRTTGQPDYPQHTVYVFGNSTLVSFELPDQYTIPSQLQALFNDTLVDKYKVINLGRSGHFASRQLDLLKRMPLQQGDIVIFYDGVIDAQIGGGESEPESLPVQFCGWLSQKMPNLALGKVFCLLIPSRGPSTDPAWWAKNAQAVTTKYTTAILEAQQYTSAKHVQFYHFLQATIYSHALSNYEQATVDNPLLISGDIRFVKAMVLHNWPPLQAAHRKLQSLGVRSTDLTHILDDIRDGGTEIYLDFYHVNELGNKRIAEAIFDTLTLL